MTGESEWATGSPITARRRVLALISTRELFDDPLHRGFDQRLELDAGVAVHLEVAAEGIADLGLVAFAAGVLAEHEHLPFPAKLVHASPVMPGHGEDEVGMLEEIEAEQPRPVRREGEPALEADQDGPVVHRR